MIASPPWNTVGNEDFDVPIGCLDGAEVCELVGLLNLTKFWYVLQRETFKKHLRSID